MSSEPNPLEELEQELTRWLGPAPEVDREAENWNVIEEAQAHETRDGTVYLVRIRQHSEPWRIIGSSRYRPVVGEQLDQSRYTYVGAGRTVDEALKSFHNQMNEPD